MNIPVSLQNVQQDLDWLQSNIYELTWALKDSSTLSESLPLTVFVGERKWIYYSKTWVVKGLEKIKSVLGYSSDQTHLISEAIFKTIENTSSCLSIYLEQYEQLYRNSYINWIKNKIAIEKTNSERNQASLLMKECSSAVMGFVIIFTQSNQDKIIEKITDFIPQQNLFKQLCCEYRQAQSLINLEGYLNQALPIPILAKLCKGQTVAPQEQFAFDKWLEQLEFLAKQERLNVKELKEAFLEIITIINLADSLSLTLDDLLSLLAQKKLSFFEKEDFDFIQKSRLLESDSKFNFNNREIVIDRQLSPQKSFKDHFQIFSLKGTVEKNCVLKIGINDIELKLEKIKIDQEKIQLEAIQNQQEVRDLATGDWHVDIIEVNQSGGGVLLEKMTISLAHYQWKSTHLPLDKQEEQWITILAKRLNLMCQKEMYQVPKKLSLEQLMINEKGEIKFLGLLELEKFNYNRLENFCNSFNPFIKSKLMQASGLIKHPIAIQFYQLAVEHAFEHGEALQVRLPQPKGFENDLYEEHLEILNKQALELRYRCIEQVKNLLLNQGKFDYERDQRALTRAVSSKLIRLYRASSTRGILQPEIEKTVVDSANTIYDLKLIAN